MNMEKFLDNLMSIIIYAVIFFWIILCTEPTLQDRQIIGYSLILGFFAGLINNLERVLREIFKNKED